MAFVLYDVFRGEEGYRHGDDDQNGLCGECVDLLEQFDCFQQNLRSVRSRILERWKNGGTSANDLDLFENNKPATTDDDFGSRNAGETIDELEEEDDDDDTSNSTSRESSAAPASSYIETDEEDNDDDIPDEEREDDRYRRRPRPAPPAPRRPGRRRVIRQEEGDFQWLPAANGQRDVDILEVISNAEKYMVPFGDPEVDDEALLRDLTEFRASIPASGAVTSSEEGSTWDLARASSFSVAFAVENEDSCFVCSVDLGSLNDKLNHHMIDHADGVYGCGICNEAMSDPEKIDDHLSLHSRSETNFYLEAIRHLESFYSVARLEDGRYQCSVCPVISPDEICSRNHWRVSHGKRHYGSECPVCKVDYKCVSTNRRHIMIKHLVKNTQL